MPRMCEKVRVRLSRRQTLLHVFGRVLGAGVLPFVPRVALAESASADVIARWLAGTTDLHRSEEWSAYAKLEDERWRASQGRLRAMQEWSARELGPLLTPDQAVFYPFAGADALHALALFGGARRLFLVGLEPVGPPALPDPQQGAPEGFFRRLGAALADLHRLGFFRTREMSSDFQQDGVLPALVATVARMGGTVTSVRTIPASSSSSGLPSARVDWTNASGEARRLDYVQADLANAGQRAHPELAREIHALAPSVTFVKAAMYLLAEPRFSQLRQAILDDSAVVVQDDTGVPFRHFDERWAVRLFGRYETPGSPFEERDQRDLHAAFDRRSPSLLPFGIGYHVDVRRSNLLIASKGH
jgi:hypothetical protein